MKRILSTLLLLALVPSALAYDAMIMHPRMTRAAFAQADTSMKFMSRLGLTGMTFGNATAADIAAMASTAEDDDNRPLRHFFDPVNDTGIEVRVPGIPLPTCIDIPLFLPDARTWALEHADNAYRLETAKEHYRSMLTDPIAIQRQQRAGFLFWTLGHTMHLVQDMAQPQHTRNDVHPTGSDLDCDENPVLCHLDLLNMWSRYERWCRDNPTQVPIVNGYQGVWLSDYDDYFSSPEKKGLADYSNRNFVTEHTNYGDSWCAQYAEPALGDATPRNQTHTVTTTSFFDDGSAYVNVVAYQDVVLSYRTFDALRGSYTENPNHSFHSYFDYELGHQGSEKVWSLPQSALKSQATLLAPRAVGYSAGLLEHFFRGTVTLKWKKNQDGTFNATLTNTSSEPLTNAQVVVKYTVTPGTHGAPAGHDLVPIFNANVPALAPGGATTYSNLTIPGLGPNENFADFVVRVAVTGTLGSEQDAVIGLVEKANVTTSGQGWITLQYQVSVSKPDDFYLNVHSRYYGNSVYAAMENGAPRLTNLVRGVEAEIVSIGPGEMVLNVSYNRGSHVWDVQVGGCDNLGPATVTLLVDDEHYATYNVTIQNQGSWGGNCWYQLPYFF